MADTPGTAALRRDRPVPGDMGGVAMTREPTRTIETEHVVPMPAVAGWTEDRRVAEMERIRRDITAQGGRITVERRVRNTAFDGRGERTTVKFTVDWR